MLKSRQGPLVMSQQAVAGQNMVEKPGRQVALLPDAT